MYCYIPEPSEPTDTIPPVLSTRFQPGATSFAQMTTIGVGGRAAQVVETDSEADFIAAISAADKAGKPLLVIGGGSNILAADSEFSGVVVRYTKSDITTLEEDSCGGARMRVAAGTPWDEVVVYAISHGWMGMEALSGIPGSAGAAPVQNIGAYGQEVAGVIAAVRTYDRETAAQRTLFLSDLELGYRNSLLKKSMTEGKWGPSPRWIVLSVDFHLRRATLSAPIRYRQLAAELQVEEGERVPAAQVRAAVLKLRRQKGMVLSADDRDTYSLGSFFTNPVLREEEAQKLPPEAPRYPLREEAAVNQIGGEAPIIPGWQKTSAAWLIAHAGYQAGYALPGPAAISTKHSLALTNRGEATAAQIMQLAEEIRAGVRNKYGVELVPEPVLVGFNH